jgi:hypothetical protein
MMDDVLFLLACLLALGQVATAPECEAGSGVVDARGTDTTPGVAPAAANTAITALRFAGTRRGRPMR